VPPLRAHSLSPAPQSLPTAQAISRQRSARLPPPRATSPSSTATTVRQPPQRQSSSRPTPQSSTHRLFTPANTLSLRPTPATLPTPPHKVRSSASLSPRCHSRRSSRPRPSHTENQLPHSRALSTVSFHAISR
jgi:hypothetical protein